MLLPLEQRHFCVFFPFLTVFVCVFVVVVRRAGAEVFLNHWTEYPEIYISICSLYDSYDVIQMYV